MFRNIGIVVTVLLAVALIISAFGGYYSPERRFAPFFILAVMALPAVLFINASTAVIWLIRKRWLAALIPIAAIAISWQSVRTVFAMHPFMPTLDKVDRSKHDATLKLLTYNVANFGPYDQTNFTPSPAMRYILDQNADVVILQEGTQERDYMKLSQNKAMVAEIKEKYPYRSGRNHDVMVMSKYKYTIIDDISAREQYRYSNNSRSGHFLVIDVQLPGRTVRVIGVHLQSIGLSDDDKAQYVDVTRTGVGGRSELRNVKRNLVDKVVQAAIYRENDVEVVREIVDRTPRDMDLIVCGDFNDTPAASGYLKLRADDLNDAWADAGFGYVNTYHDSRLLFKIDHILYRGRLTPIAIKRDKPKGSDHYPLVALFEL